jgi:hypothetical protein
LRVRENERDYRARQANPARAPGPGLGADSREAAAQRAGARGAGWGCGPARKRGQTWSDAVRRGQTW